MTYDLVNNKRFHPKQAPAFVLDRRLDESIDLSTANFCLYQPPCPQLKDKELRNALSKFTSYKEEAARQCYWHKVRLSNLKGLTAKFSDYIQLADPLEPYLQYSQFGEGRTDDGNVSQTEQHRDTKMRAILEFKRALKKANIPNIDAKVDKMLFAANVAKDGTSTAGRSTIEAAKADIFEIGKKLKLNSLYKRKDIFLMKKLKFDKADEGPLSS